MQMAMEKKMNLLVRNVELENKARNFIEKFVLNRISIGAPVEFTADTSFDKSVIRMAYQVAKDYGLCSMINSCNGGEAYAFWYNPK